MIATLLESSCRPSAASRLSCVVRLFVVVAQAVSLPSHNSNGSPTLLGCKLLRTRQALQPQKFHLRVLTS